MQIEQIVFNFNNIYYFLNLQLTLKDSKVMKSMLDHGATNIVEDTLQFSIDTSKC